MIKTVAIFEAKENQRAALLKEGETSPPVTNGGCFNTSVPCIQCRMATCLPKDQGGTTDCPYYPVEADVKKEIEALEKKRIWSVKGPPDWKVEKDYFWFLWSERCTCKANCPKWTITEDEVPVNLERCGDGRYEMYDSKPCEVQRGRRGNIIIYILIGLVICAAIPCLCCCFQKRILCFGRTRHNLGYKKTETKTHICCYVDDS